MLQDECPANLLPHRSKVMCMHASWPALCGLKQHLTSNIALLYYQHNTETPLSELYGSIDKLSPV